MHKTIHQTIQGFIILKRKAQIITDRIRLHAAALAATFEISLITAVITIRLTRRHLTGLQPIVLAAARAVLPQEAVPEAAVLRREDFNLS